MTDVRRPPEFPGLSSTGKGGRSRIVSGAVWHRSPSAVGGAHPPADRRPNTNNRAENMPAGIPPEGPHMTDLGTYKGHPVLSTTIAIRSTGHGLEEAMAVSPVDLPLGSIIHVVLECEVERHRYDPIKDTDGLQLVNMLKAGRATLVDAELVAQHLDEQQRLIEEAEGVQALPFEDGEA